MKEKSDLTWARWTHSVGSQNREGPLAEGSWRTGPVSSACLWSAGLCWAAQRVQRSQSFGGGSSVMVVEGQDGGSRVRWTQHHSLWGPCGPVATKEN